MLNSRSGLIALCLLLAMPFCGALNFTIDFLVYRALRNAPRLAPLVSARGVSFMLMNAGLFWGGAQDNNFPKLVPDDNLLAAARYLIANPIRAGLSRSFGGYPYWDAVWIGNDAESAS